MLENRSIYSWHRALVFSSTKQGWWPQQPPSVLWRADGEKVCGVLSKREVTVTPSGQALGKQLRSWNRTWRTVKGVPGCWCLISPGLQPSEEGWKFALHLSKQILKVPWCHWLKAGPEETSVSSPLPFVSPQGPLSCAGPQAWWFCCLMAWTARSVVCSTSKGGSCCWRCWTPSWTPSSTPTRTRTCTAPWRRWSAASLRRGTWTDVPPASPPPSSAGATRAASIRKTVAAKARFATRTIPKLWVSPCPQGPPLGEELWRMAACL